MIISVNPITVKPTMKGIYRLISFLTPEIDVYVEEPVKLRTTNAASAGNNSREAVTR